MKPSSTPLPLDPFAPTNTPKKDAYPGIRGLLYLKECASTNDEAKALNPFQIPLPLLIITSKQNQGRGRRNRRWWSASGSLIFSILFPIFSPLKELCDFSINTGEKIRDALLPFAPLTLKPPNDLILHKKKCGGILCETFQRSKSPKGLMPVPKEKLILNLPKTSPEKTLKENGQRFMILGIGLNLNNNMNTAAKELQKTATSFSKEKIKISPADALQRILKKFHEEKLFER